MSRMKIIGATQFDRVAWPVKQPLPKVAVIDGVRRQVGRIEGTSIEAIVLVEETVEIFARSSANPADGIHITLCKPNVSIITSLGMQKEWSEALSELDPRESVTEVIDITNKSWKLNQDVPDQGDYTIVKMAMIGESVEVFAVPKPGTSLEQQGGFLHLQLMPFYVQEVHATAPLHNWVELHAEYTQIAQDIADGVDDDDDDDNEEDDPDGKDEIDGPPFAAAPAQPQMPAPPPPPPNGASTTTPSQE